MLNRPHHAAHPPHPPLRLRPHACRHRAEARRDARPPRRRVGRRGAGHRPPLPPAGRHHRPAQAAGDRAVRRGPGGHAQGAGRPPRQAAARQQAHPLPGLRPRRHRRDRAHLLPRPRGLSGEGAAGRRDPLRQRSGRLVQRPPGDGPPGLHRRRGGFRHPAADRAGLPDDRGAFPQGADPRHRRRPRPPARPPRMAGCPRRARPRLADLRRRA